MITASPLGIFTTSLLIKHWNASQNIKMKKSVRKSLLSGKAHEVQDGLVMLYRYVPEDFDLRIHKIGSLENFFEILIEASVDHTNNQPHVTVIGEMNAAIAFYFSSHFNKGHFALIPLPQWGYEFPDLVIERRIIDLKGKMHVAGPK